MSFDDVQFQLSEHQCTQLLEWSKRLSIPVASLLHHASQGQLPLFMVPGLLSNAYFSAHQDFLETDSGHWPALGSSDAINRPVYLGPTEDLLGLILSASDCATLARASEIEKTTFDAVFRKHFHSVQRVEPPLGLPGNSLRPNGWRIVGYRKHQSDTQHEPPTSGLITERLDLTKVFVRDVDVQDFVARLNSAQFIVEFHSDGEITKDLPPYISKKLAEMIEVNRIYWPRNTKLDAPQREKVRKEAEERLRECFTRWQSKKKSNNIKNSAHFAAECCDPTVIPESANWKYRVTPQLLMLITAAKLFWSPVHVDPDNPATHPTRDDYQEFLRTIGFKAARQASDAATLITPENAVHATGATKRPPKPQTHLREHLSAMHIKQRNAEEK